MASAGAAGGPLHAPPGPQAVRAGEALLHLLLQCHQVQLDVLQVLDDALLGEDGGSKYGLIGGAIVRKVGGWQGSFVRAMCTGRGKGKGFQAPTKGPRWLRGAGVAQALAP
jgi:hypothetical protein